MRAGMLAFSAGVVLAGWVPRLPPGWLLPVLGAVALLLVALPRLRLAGALLGGICYLLCWGHWSLQLWLPADDRQLDLLVQGTVWDLPTATERGWRLQLRLEAICKPDATGCAALPRWQRRLLLITLYEALPPAPGQRWQWQLRLRRPHGFANPGGFDYEAWLLQQDIAATGYLRASPHNRRLATPPRGLVLQRLRHGLQQRLQDPALPPLLHAGFIEALSLGLRQGISEQQWRQFAQLGLTHLVVISGLHLALVCAVLQRLLLLLARCSPRLLLSCTAPRLAAAGALAGAWLYAGLAGFTLPVLRAFIMAAVFCSGPLLRRQTSSRQSLSLALLLVLLLDPLAPQSAGFWLSFGAVAILLGQQQEAMAGRLQALLQTLRLQCWLSLGLLPVMLVFFQQGSALAPVVNLLAIPWVGLLVVPCCLLGILLLPWSTALAAWPLQGADFLLDCFLRAVDICVVWWPHSLLTLPPLGAGVLLLTLVMAALVLLGRHWRWRLAGLALLPLVLLRPPPRLADGELALTVLDVGQGLAVIVRTRSQQLLYDSGPRYSERFDAGDDLLLPVLRRLGIRQLDRVIVSHDDLDHAGGLPAIMAAFPQALYLGSELRSFGPVPYRQLCRPQVWQHDGFRFAILHPTQEARNDNDNSCVLHISGAGGSVLLPGDISRSVELQLLQRYPQLRADFVVAPHHGSKSSSASAFIRRLQPKWVVYSAGYLNRFGHPAEVIRARYARAGARSLETARDGAVILHLAADAPPQVETWRARRPRFWHRLASDDRP